MSEETLLVERGPITRLTMNRPERHNALDTEMGDRLLAELLGAGRDPHVRVVLLRGAGRSFCSGDDVSEGALYHNNDLEAAGLERHPYFQVLTAIRRVPKPVIAQVHGYCLGSAMDLMMASDFAIADPDAKFRMIIPSAVLLHRLVGLKRGNLLSISSDFSSAQEMFELGLISRVAVPGQLEQDVEQLAGQLKELGEARHGAFGLMKEKTNRLLFPSLEQDVRMETLMYRQGDFYGQTHPRAADS